MKIKSKSKVDYDRVSRMAEILKTISHPVRLEILEVLDGHKGLSVSDILLNLQVEVEQSMLSHHLIKMKDKGILESWKEGQRMYYKLKDRNLLKIFSCLQNCKLL